MELNELQYRMKIRDIIIIASTGHPKFTIAISCRKEPPVVLLMFSGASKFWPLLLLAAKRTSYLPVMANVLSCHVT